jgi:hypothetical protein
VLRHASARLEGEEDDPDGPVMEERDLLVPVRASPRFGAKRTERGWQVERTLGTSEAIGRSRAATIFQCTHANSPWE